MNGLLSWILPLQQIQQVNYHNERYFVKCFLILLFEFQRIMQSIFADHDNQI